MDDNARTDRRLPKLINIRELERENTRLLEWGLLVGIGLHALLAVGLRHPHVAATTPDETGMHRMSVRLETIQPPAMHPYLLPARPLVRKRVTLEPAPRRDGEAIIVPKPLFDESPLAGERYTPAGDEAANDALASPFEVPFDQPHVPLTPDLDDDGRRPSNHISLSDEMLTSHDYTLINDGRIKGLVFINPDNVHTLRGTVIIPRLVTARTLNLSPGIEGFIEGLRAYTSLDMSIETRDLFHYRTMRHPFAYIALGGTWDYFPFESDAVGRYIREGGFVFFDNLLPWMEFSPGEASLRKLIRDALGSKARLRPIPIDHPIYHCYFDFDDGPPAGRFPPTSMEGQGYFRHEPYLEGIWIDDQLAGVYANRGYGFLWSDWAGSVPQTKMGINMLVYALLRSGGKAAKYVDYDLVPETRILRWNVELAGQMGREERAASPGR